MRHSINRITPVLPARAFQTWGVSAPVNTHWRDATCEEVECAHYLRGWRTVVDPATQQGAAQVYYIRQDRSRSCTEERLADGKLSFTFRPNQRCFTQHRVRIPRPEIFYVRGGDWRGNPTGLRRLHTHPEHWVEEHADNQSKIAEILKRG